MMYLISVIWNALKTHVIQFSIEIHLKHLLFNILLILFENQRQNHDTYLEGDYINGHISSQLESVEGVVGILAKLGRVYDVKLSLLLPIPIVISSDYFKVLCHSFCEIQSFVGLFRSSSNGDSFLQELR